jgi:hypothetical protein
MIRKIRKLFDAEFYLRTNPDVAAARMDPVKHYVKYGAAERRQPHPLFDPEHYLASCAAAGTVDNNAGNNAGNNAANPLLHFLEQSRSWANPHPLFDCDAYLRAHPDAGNPLVHYSKAAPRSAEEGSQFGQC